MTTVTVFRHPPPPVLGVCGVVFDRAFEALDPQAPAEAARFDAVRDLLEREGQRCLPLILVDGALVSSGVRPTRSRLARIVGRHRHQPDLPATV